MSEQLEPDCTYCENLVFINEEVPSAQEPIFVKRYYLCKENIFEVSFSKEELRNHYKACTVRVELTRNKEVNELITELETLNIVFRQLTETKEDVSKVDAYIGAALASPCISQTDFFNKIAYLANILDFDRKILREIVPDHDPDWKGLTLLKKYLEEKSLADEKMFDSFEQVILIRNKTYPIHRFNYEEVEEAMRKLDLAFPVSGLVDWQRNWSTLLGRFTANLKTLRKLLMASKRTAK